MTETGIFSMSSAAPAREGLFVNPAALEELGSGNMVVLDASNNSITVFAPTEYAVMIHAALDHYEHGRYDQAAEMWQQVIRLNANYELAYSGVAAAHLRQGYQTPCSTTNLQ